MHLFAEGVVMPGRAIISIWAVVVLVIQSQIEMFNSKGNHILFRLQTLAWSLVYPTLLTRNQNLCSYFLREEPGWDRQTALSGLW